MEENLAIVRTDFFSFRSFEIFDRIKYDLGLHCEREREKKSNSKLIGQKSCFDKFKVICFGRGRNCNLKREDEEKKSSIGNPCNTTGFLIMK